MKSVLAILLGSALLAGAAQAQETNAQVAVMTDWSVFAEPKSGTPTECFAVSAPKESLNTRDGQPVSVRRGEVRLFVTYSKGQKVGTISFTGGYPFAEISTVSVAVGSDTFELFTDGEFAWTADAAQDEKLMAVLKKGTNAVLTARSGKGTQTQDTFSLRGFTAATEDAAKRCQ